MAQRIVLNGISYHGSGAVAEIVGEAQEELSKGLPVPDPDLLKFGVTAKVTDLLDKAGMGMRYILK